MDAILDLRSLLLEVRAELRGEIRDLRGEVRDLRGDMNQRFVQVEHRIDVLDDKHDRHFTWLVGIQVALILAVVGAMVGAYVR